MIVGFIVNKFRGDATLFDDGMADDRERTGWRAFGLVPFFADAARLPAEDALGARRAEAASRRRVTIAVPMLPRIANFDDFDPLRMEPGVRLVFVRAGEPLPATPTLSSCPGSQGDDRRSRSSCASRAGTSTSSRMRGAAAGCSGICGGYQMLGRSVADPHGMEGPPAKVEGLGLLDVETVLDGDKTLIEVYGTASPMARRSAATRCISAHLRHTRAADAEPPTATTRAPSPATAGSAAAMSTDCWPTTASAPLARRIGAATSALRLRGRRRGHARCARRAHRKPSRLRPAAQRWRAAAVTSTKREHERIASDAELQAAGHAIEPQRAADVGVLRRRGHRPSRRRPPARRRRRAGRRAPGRAHPPWRPPASRRWASGAGARRAATAAARPSRRCPGSAQPPQDDATAPASREAGRLTRSSSAPPPSRRHGSGASGGRSCCRRC